MEKQHPPGVETLGDDEWLLYKQRHPLPHASLSPILSLRRMLRPTLFSLALGLLLVVEAAMVRPFLNLHHRP